MKSNMRSAGIRKHHRRIQHQARIDSRTNMKRAFKQKEHHPLITTLHLGLLAGLFGKVKGFFSGLFSMPSFRGLDLRRDMTLGENQNRAAGANALRAWFPNLGTMVSTRDGKRV